jgi:hypothetical protein
MEFEEDWEIVFFHTHKHRKLLENIIETKYVV